MKVTTKVDTLLSIAKDLLLDELEKRVRAVLQRDSNPAVRFVMGGGDAYFIDRRGDAIVCMSDSPNSMRWADSVYRLIDTYDDTFHLSGYPLNLKKETENAS